MGKVESDTLYGTLNLLILKTLAEGPLHGLAISRQIHASTSDKLKIEEGALYPALHRLERDELVGGSWGISETRRRACATCDWSGACVTVAWIGGNCQIGRHSCNASRNWAHWAIVVWGAFHGEYHKRLLMPVWR